MAFEIGTVTGSGLNNSASGHKMLLAALKTFLETTLPVGERWIPQRSLIKPTGTVSSITHSGATATVTMSTAPGLAVGEVITINGASDNLYNGVFTVVSVSGVTFTYTMSGTPTSNASGTLLLDRELHEIIWKAPGMSGTEEIFTGIKTYQSATSDYYNFSMGGFTGYIPLNSFETQAGSSAVMGCTLWNQAIDYWFVGNGQRVIVFIKILDVYESFYLGKYLPYATPNQYPYPLAVWASLPTASATRYDSTSLVSGFKGSRANFAIRAADGSWVNPDCSPYNRTHQLRNTITLSTTTQGYYGLHSIVLSTSAPNVYGELEGLYYISGFNNATENTIVYNSITYIVFRDRRSVGFNDYIAVRLS